MLFRSLFMLALLGSCSGASLAQTPLEISHEERSAMERIAGSIILDGHAYSYDEQLANGIGARLTGSQAYVQAVEWSIQQFKSLGLTDVHTESWTIPVAWEPDAAAVASMIEPRHQKLYLESLGWSPSTPEGGVSGQIVYVKDVLRASSLRAQEAEIRGKIALVDRESFQADGPLPLGTLLANLNTLSKMGTKALMMGYGPANNLISQKGLEADGSLSALPIAGLGNEDTLLIRQLLRKGPVTVSFAFHNSIRRNVEVKNVVAELPGRDTSSNEWVLVAGHLDSWHPGTGAQDNGTGVAAVLESARAIIASGRRPFKTIRFVLFGGEEEGQLGSRAYVKAHSTELPYCDAAIVTDLGDGAPKGWYTFGREDVTHALSPLTSLLAGFGASGVNNANDDFFNSDHTPFLLKGVPVLFLWTELDHYDSLHHLPADTFDKVDEHTLDEGTAVVALTAYAIADSPNTLAPHLTTEQMEDRLKAENIYSQYIDMKAHSMF